MDFIAVRYWPSASAISAVARSCLAQSAANMDSKMEYEYANFLAMQHINIPF
jgi:hypothetical protein